MYSRVEPFHSFNPNGELLDQLDSSYDLTEVSAISTESKFNLFKMAGMNNTHIEQPFGAAHVPLRVDLSGLDDLDGNPSGQLDSPADNSMNSALREFQELEAKVLAGGLDTTRSSLSDASTLLNEEADTDAGKRSVAEDLLLDPIVASDRFQRTQKPSAPQLKLDVNAKPPSYPTHRFDYNTDSKAQFGLSNQLTENRSILLDSADFEVETISSRGGASNDWSNHEDGFLLDETADFLVSDGHAKSDFENVNLHPILKESMVDQIQVYDHLNEHFDQDFASRTNKNVSKQSPIKDPTAELNGASTPKSPAGSISSQHKHPHYYETLLETKLIDMSPLHSKSSVQGSVHSRSTNSHQSQEKTFTGVNGHLSDRNNSLPPGPGSADDCSSVHSLPGNRINWREPGYRTVHQSVSSTDSSEEAALSSRSDTKTHLMEKLKEELVAREQQNAYIEQLQAYYDTLLAKHALAEVTIDQLRLAPQRYRFSVNSQRSDSPMKSTMDRGRWMFSRTESQDTVFSPGGRGDVFEGELSGGNNSPIKMTHPTDSPHYNGGRSLMDEDGLASKLMTDSSAGNHQLGILMRANCLEEALEWFREQISNSNDVKAMTAEEGEQVVNELKKRFDQLQNDYNQTRNSSNKQKDPNYDSNFDEDHSIEGLVFQLGMQLDELEDAARENLRSVKRRTPFKSNNDLSPNYQERNGSSKSHPSTISNGSKSPKQFSTKSPQVIEAFNRNSEMSEMEENYLVLMGRYDVVKSMSPTEERDEELMTLRHHLMTIAEETELDTSKIINSPEELENYFHLDDETHALTEELELIAMDQGRRSSYNDDDESSKSHSLRSSASPEKNRPSGFKKSNQNHRNFPQANGGRYYQGNKSSGSNIRRDGRYGPATSLHNNNHRFQKEPHTDYDPPENEDDGESTVFESSCPTTPSNAPIGQNGETKSANRNYSSRPPPHPHHHQSAEHQRSRYESLTSQNSAAYSIYREERRRPYSRGYSSEVEGFRQEATDNCRYPGADGPEVMSDGGLFDSGRYDKRKYQDFGSSKFFKTKSGLHSRHENEDNESNQSFQESNPHYLEHGSYVEDIDPATSRLMAKYRSPHMRGRINWDYPSDTGAGAYHQQEEGDSDSTFRSYNPYRRHDQSNMNSHQLRHGKPHPSHLEDEEIYRYTKERPKKLNANNPNYPKIHKRREQMLAISPRSAIESSVSLKKNFRSESYDAGLDRIYESIVDHPDYEEELIQPFFDGDSEVDDNPHIDRRKHRSRDSHMGKRSRSLSTLVSKRDPRLERDCGSEEDSYQDDVAYWTGESFQPHRHPRSLNGSFPRARCHLSYQGRTNTHHPSIPPQRRPGHGREGRHPSSPIIEDRSCHRFCSKCGGTGMFCSEIGERSSPSPEPIIPLRQYENRGKARYYVREYREVGSTSAQEVPPSDWSLIHQHSRHKDSFYPSSQRYSKTHNSTPVGPLAAPKFDDSRYLIKDSLSRALQAAKSMNHLAHRLKSNFENDLQQCGPQGLN